jgi:anti-sigma factor RsiW
MSTLRHPSETDLALFAGGESPRLQGLLLDRHVRACADCRAKVAEYRAVRDDLIDSALDDTEIPAVNWNLLASEMRANIRVGLEAGACVGATQISSPWSAVRAWATAFGPRVAVGFATLAVLAVSGFYVRDARTRTADSRNAADSAPVLQTTSSGVEFRNGDASMMLLNRSDAIHQTVNARGDIGVRVIDKGGVTINNVYLQ